MRVESIFGENAAACLAAAASLWLPAPEGGRSEREKERERESERAKERERVSRLPVPTCGCLRRRKGFQKGKERETVCV